MRRVVLLTQVRSDVKELHMVDKQNLTIRYALSNTDDTPLMWNVPRVSTRCAHPRFVCVCATLAYTAYCALKHEHSFRSKRSPEYIRTADAASIARMIQDHASRPEEIKIIQS